MLTDAVCCDQLVKQHNATPGERVYHRPALKMEIKLSKNVKDKDQRRKKNIEIALSYACVTCSHDSELH